MTALLLLCGAAVVACLPAHRARAFLLAMLETAGGLAILAAQLVQLPEALPLPAEWWSSKFTGAAFAFSGAAGILLARLRVAEGQLIAFAMLLFAALLGLGHVFPSADLYAWMPGTGVAIPTVLAFIALSMGQLLSFGDTGMAGALSSRNTAGPAGLRLLVGGLAIAMALTVAVVVAYRHGAFDAETAVLLVAWAAMALLGATLWGLAATVDRAERARETAERDRNQVRQMVAAALTHDLRSPLQAATLSAAILERVVCEPAGVAAIARLHRSHRRLERLLRSLLDSLALGSGRPLAFEPSHIALQQLVQDVIAENEAVLGARVACDGEAEGWWDRDALFRVIENLLLNAVKYGEHASMIGCRIAQGTSDEVVVAVENRGSPIPSSEWDSIFQPFARGEHVRGTGPVGWGVGLAYARSVAISHGGSVQVAASGSAGTVFELRLPVDSRLALERSRAS